MTDDTDPAAAPTRRIFTPAQKLSILASYEAATESGAKGALLRREGIYSSQITEWKKARDAGTLGGSSRTGRSADRKEADRLRKKNERLEAELEKTRTALDIMGKVQALLEGISKSADAVDS